MSEEFLITIVGWLGVIFYTLAYFLLSIGKLTSGGYTFHTLNILGATSLMIDSYYYRDIPNFFANLFWLLIAAFVITKRLVSADHDGRL